jgi:hypothetical protein
LPELGTAENRIIAIAYDHPDGETIILIVNQAFISRLYDSLVCDKQCRMNGMS